MWVTTLKIASRLAFRERQTLRESHPRWPAWRRFTLALAASLSCLGAASWHIWNRLGRPRTGIDDADITLVYARHLSAGHGFVYNVGGERVEGASSPLWTFLAAAVSRLTAVPEPILAVASVLAVSLALATLMHVVSEQVRADDPASPSAKVRGALAGTAVLLWSLAAPEFTAWTCLSLMETGLWCAELVTATAILLVWVSRPVRNARSPRALAFLTVAIVLTRPEGVLVSLLLLLLAACVELITREKASRALDQLRPAVVATVVTVAASTVIRLLYFGVPLPNAFYAKIGGDVGYELAQGWAYWQEFGRASLGALVATLVGILFAAGALLQKRKGSWVRPERAGVIAGAVWIGAVVVALQAIPVLLGGDHFEGFRFYQPIWPLLALPFALAIRRAPTIRGERGTSAVFACVIAASSIWLACVGHTSAWRRPGRLPIRLEFQIAAQGREVGRTLNRFFPADGQPSIGVITAGGIKVAYPGPTYDLMGINWIRMAHAGRERYGDRGHAAFDASVFWSLPPAIVIASVLYQDAHPVKFIRESFENQVLHGLLFDPDFSREYQFGRVSRPGDARAEGVVGYFRRDFLASLVGYPGITFDAWPTPP